MRYGGARSTTADSGLELVRDDTKAPVDVEELYTQYADRVFKWALRFGGGNVPWAEDVTQGVFMNLVKRPPQLEEINDLGGWFYRVTANRCLNELRRQRLLRAISAGLLAMGAESTGARTQETVVMARGELDHALQAVRALPPAQRIVFSMRHLDGLSQQEIARILSYSKGHVSRLLKRAVGRLRDAGWRLDDE